MDPKKITTQYQKQILLRSRVIRSTDSLSQDSFEGGFNCWSHIQFFINVVKIMRAQDLDQMLQPGFLIGCA